MSISILKHGYLYRIKDNHACIGIFNHSHVFPGFEIIRPNQFYRPSFDSKLINHPNYKIFSGYFERTVALCELEATPFTDRFSNDKLLMDQKTDYLSRRLKTVNRCNNCTCTF